MGRGRPLLCQRRPAEWPLRGTRPARAQLPQPRPSPAPPAARGPRQAKLTSCWPPRGWPGVPEGGEARDGGVGFLEVWGSCGGGGGLMRGSEVGAPGRRGQTPALSL